MNTPRACGMFYNEENSVELYPPSISSIVSHLSNGIGLSQEEIIIDLTTSTPPAGGGGNSETEKEEEINLITRPQLLSEDQEAKYPKMFLKCLDVVEHNQANEPSTYDQQLPSTSYQVLECSDPVEDQKEEEEYNWPTLPEGTLEFLDFIERNEENRN